jgi:hypothetical protein
MTVLGPLVSSTAGSGSRHGSAGGPIGSPSRQRGWPSARSWISTTRPHVHKKMTTESTRTYRTTEARSPHRDSNAAAIPPSSRRSSPKKSSRTTLSTSRRYG